MRMFVWEWFWGLETSVHRKIAVLLSISAFKSIGYLIYL